MILRSSKSVARGYCYSGLMLTKSQRREATLTFVCIIKPSDGILDDVLGKLGGKYDIKVFENLPLYVKIEVIRHHEVNYMEMNLIYRNIFTFSESYGKVWSTGLRGTGSRILRRGCDT